MCRLLGYVAKSPTTSDEILGATQCITWQRMSALHRDGWGTAWIEDDAVRRYRDAQNPHGSPDLEGALTDTPSIARVTHLRLATEGMRNQISNTHPFRVDGIAFMHNGSVRPIDELRALIDEAAVAEVGGSTDSAIVFALILRRVRQGASLLDATTEVVADLRSRFPSSALNLMLLDANQLIVVHANEGAPVPVEEFEASGLGRELPRDHETHYYRLSYRQTDSDITFSSSGLDTVGWTHMAQHEAIRVDLATLELQSVRFDRASKVNAA